MANFTGTVTKFAAAGDRGELGAGICSYTLTGAIANGDTITWTNAVPSAKQARIIDMIVSAPELDTSGSPTGTATVGDGTDADGYNITFNLGKPVQAPANGEQIVNHGTGALIGTANHSSGNIVLTVTGVMATSATTGTIIIRPLVEGI